MTVLAVLKTTSRWTLHLHSFSNIQHPWVWAPKSVELSNRSCRKWTGSPTFVLRSSPNDSFNLEPNQQQKPPPPPPPATAAESPLHKFQHLVSTLPSVPFPSNVMRLDGYGFLVWCSTVTAFLFVVVRVYAARKARHDRPGTVADLVRRGQLRSDRRGITKPVVYDDPFNNPFVKIGKGNSTVEMCGKVYRLAPVTLTKEEQATHQKRRSRAYQWKRPTIFLKEGDSIPPDVDPDTVRWIPANHPFATTASDIDEDLAQNNVYQKHGVPYRIQAEHEALQRKLEALQNKLNKLGNTFEVMYLVNAVFHKGILNQHQISESFFDILRGQSTEINVAALKHLFSYRHQVYDACKRLKSVQDWLVKNPLASKCSKQLDDIAEIRRLVVTPSKAYCLPPEVELSNRVLRKYKDVADRFLRVTFMDEGMQTINSSALSYFVAPIVREITSNPFPQKTQIFKRVKSILTDGFYLCGRKYSFLAFSSNQLRDRSAWFFAEDGKTNVLQIKTWMGKFTNKNVARCAARMGQCFSSTYATIEVPSHEVNPDLNDVKRNKYVFSDGIGMITPDLGQQVAEKLKLDMDPPCAYQIRYAGFKGVVACWPAKGDGIRLALRESMYKFHSTHTTLEICSWTRFQPGFLNRQIITLLSTLGVPDEIFWNMQFSMVSKLNKMLVDKDVAFDVLTASCADQGNVPAIMLGAGFKPQSEPHLRGMLTCIRAAQLWGLREKARIFVDSGRWLMGCFDELGVLEQGQCFIQVSNWSLEQCFVKHGSRFQERKKNLQVIQGMVVIAKNPCLHPGDVRILEAVDAPGLRHLHDCLVFPQKGDRPHPNEASGSDLDGDLYFVTWDKNLIPPSKRSWTPMQYDAAEAKLLNRPVTHQDIIEFFVKNMVTENLGAICNAHVVHADRSDYGALDENCIKLAELAATAVDFPKTGMIVSLPSHLKPKLYPDFMGKEDYQSYESKKILGRLYREVKDLYNEGITSSSELNVSASDIPYDTALEVSGSDEFLNDAWEKKCSYDRQVKGLLLQYKVKKEEEIVTGHIWSMPKLSSRKQGDLKERLKHSYSSLRKEFRQVFETLSPEFEGLSEEQKNEIFEKKASAWFQVTYHPDWVRKSIDLGEEGSANPTMLSFPWIAADYVARIKIKKQGMESIDTSKPVNSIAKYLTDRM